MEKYLKVEGHSDLVRDTETGAIINTNKNAYIMAKQRATSIQKRNDELRQATREINVLKNEMHEIKNLLRELINNHGD